MIRENFERRKSEINAEIQEMLVQIQEMLDLAISCLSETVSDETLRRSVKMDRKVNNIEESIYHHCIQLISLEQPVASDLRFSIGVLKFLGDLERIGDHCVHIVKALNRGLGINVPNVLFEMCEGIRQVYLRTRKAIEDFDSELAMEIITADKNLDDVHKAFIKENAQRIHSEPENSDAYINLMFISRFIERIGDHLGNVCEWLVFIDVGTRPA